MILKEYLETLNRTPLNKNKDLFINISHVKYVYYYYGFSEKHIMPNLLRLTNLNQFLFKEIECTPWTNDAIWLVKNERRFIDILKYNTSTKFDIKPCTYST